jgi:hypothetical protein
MASAIVVAVRGVAVAIDGHGDIAVPIVVAVLRILSAAGRTRNRGEYRGPPGCAILPVPGRSPRLKQVVKEPL